MTGIEARGKFMNKGNYNKDVLVLLQDVTKKSHCIYLNCKFLTILMLDKYKNYDKQNH